MHVIKAQPFFWYRVRFRVPPGDSNTVAGTTSLRTGRGPVSYVQLSDGRFQGGLPRLVIPGIRRYQSLTQLWLAIANHSHVHLPV